MKKMMIGLSIINPLVFQRCSRMFQRVPKKYSQFASGAINNSPGNQI